MIGAHCAGSLTATVGILFDAAALARPSRPGQSLKTNAVPVRMISP